MKPEDKTYLILKYNLHRFNSHMGACEFSKKFPPNFFENSPHRRFYFNEGTELYRNPATDTYYTYDQVFDKVLEQLYEYEIYEANS